MTTCPDATELAAYLEGSGDELAAERFERHAAGCEQCAAALELATRLPEVALLPKDLSPPVAARRVVLDAVAVRRGRRRLQRWAGMIAAGLLLVIIGSLAGPRPKEASTRPPLGPPLPLQITESAAGVHEVHVTQAIGTLTVEAIDGAPDITWTGTRDDLTEVVVVRLADTLSLAVVPRDGARWPAEAQGTLVVPSTMRVVVTGRGLLVRDRWGTADIRIRGRGDLEVVDEPR